MPSEKSNSSNPSAPKRVPVPKRRRFLRFFAGLALTFLVVLALMPWWLGPALRRTAPALGASFSTYERLGYSRFALRDIVVRQSGVEVTVSRVEANTPLLWAFRRLLGKPTAVSAELWKVQVQPQPNRTTRPSKKGWLSLRTTLMNIAASLDRWLPQARVGAGSVQWPGGGLTIDSATWAQRTLTAENLKLGPLQTKATLSFPVGEDVLKLNAQLSRTNGSAELESRGTNIDGTLQWLGQTATLHANFTQPTWLPSSATLLAEAWQFPGDALKLSALYASVRGRGKIEWSENQFNADLSAHGEPLAGKNAPPLDVNLRGHGDTESFTVETLQANLPGISAQLSAPVTVDRQGNFRQSVASFTLQADLAQQPWFAAKGTLNGVAKLVAGVAQSPVIDFSLAAQNVASGQFNVGAAEANGRFAWPRIEISSGRFTLSEGEKIEGHGGWDFRAKEILKAALTGTVHRDTLARWLPEQLKFETLRVEAQANGPLASLAHSGELHVEQVNLPRLNPFATAITWSGRGETVESFTAALAAGTTTLSASGAASSTEINLSKLTLDKGGETILKLSQAARIRLSPTFEIEAHLSGEGEVSTALTWGEAGRVDLGLRGISSAWFTEFVPLPGPGWIINSIALSGAWDRGPMTYTLTGETAIALGDDRTASVKVAAKGDPDGVQIESLSALTGTTKIFTASGGVPFVFTPKSKPLFQIMPEGALAFEASVESDGAFWARLAELTGVELTTPQASARVAGTWEKPVGEIRVRAARVAMDSKRFNRPMPALESLDLALKGDREAITLETFSVSIEGQPVRAQGKLPVAAGSWKSLQQQPVAFARDHADFHLEVPEADVAAFAQFLPPFLAQQGKFQIDLNYGRGGTTEGFLRLSQAATRPLGPLGVLQEIKAEVKMSGRKIELGNVSALSGGQPVTLTGTIEIPADAEPRYDVALRGANLPFVRQTGLLVRGDVDLKLQTPDSGPPKLSGAVKLHDSLFVSDLRALIPTGAKRGAKTPPYFAVEAAPFDAWKLDVSVSGERFMRVRTAVFNGVATARFQLGGRLGDPRMIGEVVIDEGQVLMPFARFSIRQGTVRITEENPNELALFLRGTGRRIGYQLTLEVTGTATSPVITFTSSPPLDSEQLLLMVMTGTAPSNEISYSSSQRFARLGTFLGQNLIGGFGDDAASPDRLSISSGEQVSRQGREVYDVEYQMDNRWKLILQYDEFDDYNVGLKWRLYPKKTKLEAARDETK